MILIFLGAFTRFWVIQYPRHMVEAEERQIHITNSFLNGSFYLDSDPPFASLILVGAAEFAAYDLSFSLPRTEVNYSYQNMQYVTMRSTPAYAGMMVVPLSFCIVRSLGGTRLASVAAGCFCLFDFLLIGLSRHFFTDGLIQLFVAVTVFATTIAGHFRALTGEWWVFVVIQALFLGFSISSRLSTVGLWVFVLVAQRRVQAGLVINLLVPVLVFVLSFCFQVYLMPLHSIYDGILSESYQTLLADGLENYHLSHLTIIPRALQLIRLHFERYGTVQGEPGQWISWPLMVGEWRVLWTQLGRTVAAFGNPAVWWPMTFAVVALLLQAAVARGIPKDSQSLAIGWLASLLYFAVSQSERGICDYEIAVLFGIWALALFIDAEASERIGGFLFAAIVAIAAILFRLWGPLIYGYENFDPRLTPYFAR
jgi:dolichyl-phosphate-mannose--protein O-mannosyl transferase